MTLAYPIVALDCETTSLRPDRRAWEVGMIRRDPDGTQREVAFFVALSDIDLPNAHPFSLDIGRFWQRHPEARNMLHRGLTPFDPNWGVCRWRLGVDDVDVSVTHTVWDVPDVAVLNAEDAATVVSAWTHGATLIGNVPWFDAEVLAALLRDNWLTPSWHYHLVDVFALMLGAHGRGGNSHPRSKSDDLSRLVGVEPPTEDERHTAIGDARWALRIYDHITGGNA